MTIALEKPLLALTKIHHRDADWWGLKCSEKEPFNSIVRKLEGRRWSATWQAWLVPVEPYDLQQLETVFANKYALETSKEPGQLRVVADKTSTFRSPTVSNAQSTGRSPKLSTENKLALELFHKELVLKGYSPSTLKTYEGEFTQFLTTIKGVPAKDFTVERLKDYLFYCLTTLKLTEATLHSKMNALKFYYEQVLGRERFFWEIPRPKKREQNPAMFNQDEIAAIIKGTDNLKHKAMLMVAYSSGLRVSEVVALKPTDIDSKRMCLHIVQGKGKKDRMVSLSPVLLVILRAYWQECETKPKVYLFEGQEAGTPYSTRSLQQVLFQAKARAAVKKKGSIHALRHSFATHLLDKGADVTMIMKLLGHNDVRTTMRYLHVSNRDLLQIISPLDTLSL